MSDTIASSRVEPNVSPGTPVSDSRAVVAVPDPVSDRPSTLQEQLARLEDKTARIEEKLSRADSTTARVIDRFEASSHRMSEVAQQSDLLAIRSETKYIARRVKNLPGFPALILTSIVTAILTAVITIAIIRYMPTILGR